MQANLILNVFEFRLGNRKPGLLPGQNLPGSHTWGMRKQLVAAQSIPAVLRICIEANADPDPAFKVNAYTNPEGDPGFGLPKILENYIFLFTYP
jgi:hypothetical protein